MGGKKNPEYGYCASCGKDRIDCKHNTTCWPCTIKGQRENGIIDKPEEER